MHGLGNDFVVLDAINQPINVTPALAARLGDRRFGIGCDQILVVESADDPANDFKYRIFNNDGSEVEQCGNGVRCFARFVVDKGLTTKTRIQVETSSGIVWPELRDDGEVIVNMGPPNFDPSVLPFQPAAPADAHGVYTLAVDEGNLAINALSMGNPHAVLLVADVEDAPAERVGKLIQAHDSFPAQVNVGFMQIVDRQRIKLRVYERGAGETLACGTGACAAVVAGIQRGELDNEVKATLRGGELTIRWDGGDAPVMMTGPATTVFEGSITL